VTSLSAIDLATVPNRRYSGVLVVLAGLMVGALWGVLARAWMRFVSAAPEFSWSGTLMIIGIFAFCGMAQGLAAAARRGGWPRPARIAAQTAAIASAVPLGLGAGSIMMPSTLLAGFAIGRTEMNRLGRIALAALAFLPTTFVLTQLVDELPLWRAVAGWVLMFAIYLPISWALSRTIRTLGAPGRRLSNRQIVVLLVVGGIVVLGLMVTVFGLAV